MMNNSSSVPFPLAGEVFALGAALIWGVAITLFAHFGTFISPKVLNLFKGIVSSFCFALSLFFVKENWPSQNHIVGELVASGIFGLFIGDTFFFFALSLVGVQTTAILQCLSPALAALFAWIFLHEELNQTEVLGMVVTISALIWLIISQHKKNQNQNQEITIVLEERKRAWSKGILFAVLAATCQAIGIVSSRHGLEHCGIVTAASIRVIPSTLALALFAAYSREIHQLKKMILPLYRKSTVFLFLASLGGTFIGVIFLTAATKYTKAGIATAISASYPLWVIPMAAYIFKEKISLQTLLAAFLAVTGIGILAWDKM